MWDPQRSGAVLASGLGVCSLFTKHLAAGQTQHNLKVSSFCLSSVVITVGQLTIHSHLTLMLLSCLCCDQLFMYNKGGGKKKCWLSFCLIHFLPSIRHGDLLHHDTSYFPNGSGTLLPSERQVFTGFILKQTHLERSAMTDGEEAILQTCVKFNWLFFIM